MDRFGLLCRNIYEKKKITQRELAAAYISITSGHGSTLSILSISTNIISMMNSTGDGESDEVWLDTMWIEVF